MKMGRLVSVNVGLPREIPWNGRTVYTGIWKNPVPGRCRVSRLNLAAYVAYRVTLANTGGNTINQVTLTGTASPNGTTPASFSAYLAMSGRLSRLIAPLAALAPRGSPRVQRSASPVRSQASRTRSP